MNIAGMAIPLDIADAPPPDLPGWVRHHLPGRWALLAHVWVGEVVISPESAAWILGNLNTCNRRPVPAQLKRIVRALERDEWMLTGETLIFNREGKVSNGQHRLMGCVRSEKPLTTLAVFGVDPDAFRVMDQHAKRTFGNVFDILGQPHGRTLAASLTTLLQFFKTGEINRDSKRASNLVIGDLLAASERFTGLDDSVAYARGLKCKVFQGPSNVATLHWLFARVDVTLANQFFRDVAQGRVEKGPEWQPLFKLRQSLEANLQDGKKLVEGKTEVYCIKAWNAIRERKEVGIYRKYPGEEFPRISGWQYKENKPVGTETEVARADANQ